MKQSKVLAGKGSYLRIAVISAIVIAISISASAQRKPWQMGDDLDKMVFVYHDLKTDKYRLVDIKGKALSTDYPYMEKFRNESRVAIFRDKNGKYGIIGADGKVLVKAEFDNAKIYKGRDTDRDAVIAVTRKGKTGLYDQDGNLIVDFKYTSIDNSYNDGLLYTTSGDKIGALNASNFVEVVPPGKYDEIIMLTPVFAAARTKNDYKLFCVADGKVAVPYPITKCIVPRIEISQFDVSTLSTMLIECADGYYMVTPEMYTFISNVGDVNIVSEGIASVDHDKRYYVDIDGNVFEDPDRKLYVVATPQGTRVLEKGSGKADGVKMSDASGRVLLRASTGYTNPEWLPEAGLFRMSKGAKIAFVDPHGNVVIPALYTAAGNREKGETEYTADRFVVKKKGKVGVVDRANKVIVPFNYTQIIPELNADGTISHYRAQAAGKTSLLNTSGKQMIAPTSAPIIDYDFKYLDKAVKGGRFMVPDAARGTFSVYDSAGKLLGKRSMSKWWRIDTGAERAVDYYSDWTDEERANEFFVTYNRYYTSNCE